LAAWNGTIRVWRDVSIAADTTSPELSVVSDEPGVVHEEMTLGLSGPEGRVDLRVRVLESQPHVVDGIVRHRLRLLMLGATT
jgi:hypothetical protein